MLQGSNVVKGLVKWLTGGLSTRLEFVERDLESLQGQSRRLSQQQDGLAGVVYQQQEELARHRLQLHDQASQMVALRKMHAALSGKIGQAFPGRACASCGGAMIFNRAAADKAYSLECAARCGEKLLLPEANLLKSFGSAGLAP